MSNSPWVGIWRNEALGAELLLAGDGRFGFRGPNGAAHGRYRIDSGGLWLVDAGGTTWAYRVVALDAQSLQLVDPFGVPLRYERAQPPSLASGAVLAVKAIHELHRGGGKYALVTMCIGGGQGIAAIFERL